MTGIPSISLEEFRIGRRYKFGGLVGDLRLATLYDNSVPQNPDFVDEWAGITSYGSAAPPNRTSIGPSDDKRDKYSIGIVADVHQNTAVLDAVLQQFAERDVLGLFCLGDYCFTSSPDATGKRASQVRKVLELVRGWLDSNEERQAVILLGNHEVESHYYESEDVHDLVMQVILEESKHPRIYMPSDPFRSFEMDNAVDVTVFFGNSLRSFRLSHAITKEFVTSMYLGLDEEHVERSKARIISSLGLSWLKLQARNYPTVRANWEEFIRSPLESDKRRKCAWDICSHIQTELQAPEIVKKLATIDDKLSRHANGYIWMVKRCMQGVVADYDLEAFASFWGPPTLMEAEFTGLEFARDIRKLYSALGYGSMYSVCGHFHADLGVFQACPEFGTFIIGVGGFQPGKLIGSHFTAYVIECTADEDIVIRLTCPDPGDTAVESLDLSLA